MQLQNDRAEFPVAMPLPVPLSCPPVGGRGKGKGWRTSGILCLLLLLCSCTPRFLDVRTEYLSRENLASYHVGTPDPQLKNPLIGQRLIVAWSLRYERLKQGPLSLLIKIRFRNREESEKCVAIHNAKGLYIYTVFEEEYIAKGGIQTYKVSLMQNGTLLEEWRHQLWAELITFEEPPPTPLSDSEP